MANKRTENPYISEETKARTLAEQLSSADTSRGVYTAVAIAETYKVTSATIRTRWYPRLKAITEESGLKVGSRYTELAQILFSDYYKKVASRGLPAVEQGFLANDWVDTTREIMAGLDVVAAEVVDDEDDQAQVDIPARSQQIDEATSLALRDRSSAIEHVSNSVDAIDLRLEIQTLKNEQALAQLADCQEIEGDGQDAKKQLAYSQMEEQLLAHWLKVKEISDRTKSQVLGEDFPL